MTKILEKRDYLAADSSVISNNYTHILLLVEPTRIFTYHETAFVKGSAALQMAIWVNPINILPGECKVLTTRGFEKVSGQSIVYNLNKSNMSSGTYQIRLIALPLLKPNDTGRLLVHDYVFNLDFYANVTTGFSPLNVQFYNKSQSPVDFWLWDFGDGVTSNEKNPTHTYFKNGVFTVTLLTGSPTTGYKMAEKEYYISTFPGINEFTALLLQQYNTTPHVAGMVNINAEQTSQLMNAIKEARQLLLLSSAVGKQLDLIGEIQGYSRSSDDDEEYRTLLQYASILNNSEGSAEDLISYCVHIISATDVHLYEIFPAGILIEVTSTKAIIPLYIEQLKQIKSAGVRLLGVTKIVDNEFRFDTEGSGFSYSTMNDNGHFSYLYGG